MRLRPTVRISKRTPRIRLCKSSRISRESVSIQHPSPPCSQSMSAAKSKSNVSPLSAPSLHHRHKRQPPLPYPLRRKPHRWNAREYSSASLASSRCLCFMRRLFNCSDAMLCYSPRVIMISRMPLLPGTKLGEYEILGPLGAGSMGEVYRARDTRLNRDVAIKVLPELASADSERLQRFEIEAKAAAALNHPNILSVFQMGTHNGTPYLVSELLEGKTLAASLSRGPLPLRQVIQFGIQIAHGLAAAHEKGIVHRDLKPENLFVTKEGRIKILDFGLAKLIEVKGSTSASNLPTATEPGIVMGTLGYMSPEQIKNGPADARSDIFALGAILYEMLSGQRAFRGDSAGETMASILKEDPPDLSVTNKNISPGLERIVRHCLEKNPERRFQSASDIAFHLESLSGVSTPRLQAPAKPARVPRPVGLA